MFVESTNIHVDIFVASNDSMKFLPLKMSHTTSDRRCQLRAKIDSDPGTMGIISTAQRADDVVYLFSLKLTASLPLKIGKLPKGNEKVFQPSIFRCENVSFREGTSFLWRTWIELDYILQLVTWISLKYTGLWHQRTKMMSEKRTSDQLQSTLNSNMFRQISSWTKQITDAHKHTFNNVGTRNINPTSTDCFLFQHQHQSIVVSSFINPTSTMFHLLIYCSHRFIVGESAHLEEGNLRRWRDLEGACTKTQPSKN